MNPRRYFYDTEFIEDGVTIDLISIGIVAEDGREFYGISTEFNPDAAGPFVRREVLSKLPPRSAPEWMSRAELRDAVLRFLLPDAGSAPTQERYSHHDKPELWAWIAAYDHVALAQLFGDMTQYPPQLPYYTNELRQLWEFAGRPRIPNAEASDAHSALADARIASRRYDVCMGALAESQTGTRNLRRRRRR